MDPSRFRSRRPSLYISTSRKQNENTFLEEYTESGGALTPDVQGSSSPTFQKDESPVQKVGKYLVLNGGKDTSGAIQMRRAIHLELQKDFSMKVVPLSNYRELLAPYWAAGDHPNISEIQEILLDSKNAFVVFQQHFEDLHSYVRRRRRLCESEAARLFRQMATAVKHCHRNGVILRDLKLRKFVFMDAERTRLSLEGLEEAQVLSDSDDDRLTDKHGCLAYVSPEILYSTQGYSGRAADIWSLGVVLYTMLMGQYPFHDSDISALFKKIRQGSCMIPDAISPLAKCLLRNLLRTDPLERLTIKEVLKHPWFNSCQSKFRSGDASSKEYEQVVPELQPEPSLDLSSSVFGVSATAGIPYQIDC